MNNPPIKHKMKTIQEEWKIYCRTLYASVLQLEKRAVDEFMVDRKKGVTFKERNERLERCERYKKKILDSADNKNFDHINAECFEVINEKGFETYFRQNEVL